MQKEETMLKKIIIKMLLLAAVVFALAPADLCAFNVNSGSDLDTAMSSGQTSITFTSDPINFYSDRNGTFGYPGPIYFYGNTTFNNASGGQLSSSFLAFSGATAIFNGNMTFNGGRRAIDTGYSNISFLGSNYTFTGCTEAYGGAIESYGGAMTFSNSTVNFINNSASANAGAIKTKEANKRLSRQRARSVHDEFVKTGIPSNKISYEGFGDSMPVKSNKTAAGRAANRRTEIFVE